MWYNGGGIETADGAAVPPERWGISAIEPLFDHVRSAGQLDAASYGIYGHGAGGQYIHRHVLHHPNARYNVAISSNIGFQVG